MHRVDPFDPGIAVALSGFENKPNVFRNLEAPRLYEEAIRRGEANIASGGALVAETGAHTGRSPQDKFIVRDGLTEASIWWDNSHAMTRECFDRLRADMIAHASGMDLFGQDLHAGAEPRHRLKARVYTEYAWHSLFIRNLLIPIGNSNDRTLAGEAQCLLDDDSPLVRGAAVWALAQLLGREEFSARAARALHDEPDETVRAEWSCGCA